MDIPILKKNTFDCIQKGPNTCPPESKAILRLLISKMRESTGPQAGFDTTTTDKDTSMIIVLLFRIIMT